MSEAASPVLVSVIVLAVIDLTRRAVAEQGRIRIQIEDLVRAALRPLPVDGRIVLNAPQGIVVAVLDYPRDALEFAQRVQAAAGNLPLCIGINHGAVTIVEDTNRALTLAGDGIAAGMTMAQAAAPAKMIASRSFLEALRTDAPGSAARLGPAGTYTDAQVRTHELYTLDQHTMRSRRTRLLLAGAMAFSGVIFLGVVARMALFGSGLRAAPAIIEFQVKPRGDIYIDGVLKGRTPPLKSIEITPGRHTIEVHNSPHPPLKVEVNPGSAEEMIIAHTFVARSAGAKPSKGGSASLTESWRSLRRFLGF